MRALDHRLRVLMTETISRAPDFGEAVARAVGLETATFHEEQPLIDFLARCSTKAAERNLAKAGATIRGVIPGKSNVVVGRAPIWAFTSLAELRGVERIEMARPLELDLKQAKARQGFLAFKEEV
jgi:hypothetical protein